MMTSSGDDNRPSGSLGLLTDKTTKKKINKPKAEQETAQPTAARFNKVIKGKTSMIPRRQVYRGYKFYDSSRLFKPWGLWLL